MKPGETVNTERYRKQIIDLNQSLSEKRPEYQKRQHKVILLHDNAPSHTAKPSRKRLPDLAPSDYYLFASMRHALPEERFNSYENMVYENGSMINLPHPWDIHKLPEMGKIYS